MNRINRLFKQKQENILSIFFTAGYPELESTNQVLKALMSHEVDLVEVGIPFSDPLADGKTIRNASHQALSNGMSLTKLFEQLQSCRTYTDKPILLMGYLNPILNMGVETFCEHCVQAGVDGLIIPDLPFEIYLDNYSFIEKRYNLKFIPLLTPETDPERIRFIDQHTDAFHYLVSSNAITGEKNSFENQEEYFKRIKEMNLKNPHLIGFGISNYLTSSTALKHASGVIVGSKFMNLLSARKDPSKAIQELIATLSTPN